MTSVSPEKVVGILIEIMLNLCITLGNTNILTVLSFSALECGMSLYLFGLLNFPSVVF